MILPASYQQLAGSRQKVFSSPRTPPCRPPVQERNLKEDRCGVSDHNFLPASSLFRPEAGKAFFPARRQPTTNVWAAWPPGTAGPGGGGPRPAAGAPGAGALPAPGAAVGLCSPGGGAGVGRGVKCGGKLWNGGIDFQQVRAAWGSRVSYLEGFWSPFSHPATLGIDHAHSIRRPIPSAGRYSSTPSARVWTTQWPKGGPSV